MTAGETTHIYFSCQPPLPSGNLRIVLYWDNWQIPGADLDAHLYVPVEEYFDILSWEWKDHEDIYWSNTSGEGAHLDRDGGIQLSNSNEPSPETITITNIQTDGSGVYDSPCMISTAQAIHGAALMPSFPFTIQMVIMQHSPALHRERAEAGGMYSAIMPIPSKFRWWIKRAPAPRIARNRKNLRSFFYGRVIRRKRGRNRV